MTTTQDQKYVDCENFSSWSGEWENHSPGEIISLPEHIALARQAAGALKILKNQGGNTKLPALIPIERHPDFAVLLGKREMLRTRRADCERARATLAAIVPAAQIYDLAVERLIDNPLAKIEGPEGRQRREQLDVLDREHVLIRRALESLERQLVQMRATLSGEVRRAHLASFKEDTRRALAAALRLRLVEGQRSARISRLSGHGYGIGGLPTTTFGQAWGAVADSGSHWGTILRELCDTEVLSQEEVADIVAGHIPAVLEQAEA